MKLLYSAASPFARKVLVAAHEIGLANKIEIVPTKTADPALAQYNPLMKVPALVMDDGSTLIDSPLICEYLDSLHDGRKLFPADGASRWITLKLQALGDGVGDAVLLRRYEMARPESFCWPETLTKQSLKIAQGLEQLDREVVSFRDDPTIGEISIAAMVGYLDLRFPEEGWRRRCQRLARWYEGFKDRPSMQATRPPEA